MAHAHLAEGSGPSRPGLLHTMSRERADFKDVRRYHDMRGAFDRSRKFRASRNA